MQASATGGAGAGAGCPGWASAISASRSDGWVFVVRTLFLPHSRAHTYSIASERFGLWVLGLRVSGCRNSESRALGFRLSGLGPLVTWAASEFGRKDLQVWGSGFGAEELAEPG